MEERKRKRERGREGVRNRKKEERIVFKPFKYPLEGSRGCQISGASQYLLPACVRVSFCIPVRSDLCSSVRLSCLYLHRTCVWEENIIAPQGMNAHTCLSIVCVSLCVFVWVCVDHFIFFTSLQSSQQKDDLHNTF